MLSLACLAAGAGLEGCRPGPTPGPPPKAAVTQAPTAPKPAAEPSATPPEPTVVAAPTPSETAEVPTSQPGEAADAGSTVTSAVEGAVPPVSTERIILLVPHRPLVIEFQLAIDGRPHTEALTALVSDVLTLADADGDEQTTWKEMCDCKQVKYGQYGNLPIEGDEGAKQIIDQYDIDRDKVVDETELPRFLTRNAGGARPFSIRGSLDYRDTNRRGAATWRILDSDEDGALSQPEMTAAASRLASRDTDDDEILLVADLDSRLQEIDPRMMMNERRRRGPDAARLLGPHADWGSVQLALEQFYGGNRSLKSDSFPGAPGLFDLLDTNRDGRLQRTELSGLNDVPVDLVIGLAFGTGTPSAEDEEQEAAPNKPTLRLIRVAPEVTGSGHNIVGQPGRFTLSTGGLVITFYTNDAVASEDFAARAQQALAMFDGNKDGYLEKSEVPETLQGQIGRFEALDADEDGKAFPSEIEAFLLQQQAGLRAQIHARASDREDALFAALDADHDQRLDSREVEGARQRLLALDQDASGQITADELPEAMLFGLARGSLENADATFRPPPVIARRPDEKAPKWFTAMDANSDGAISRREFVGTSEKFQELDANADGLLDASEAPNMTSTGP